ncbi:MAG: hydroxymethylglutaryl-CoA lyase [Nitrospiraceae bacterium]|nr:MAG: hydroxymethylglutaryl-CoA lyase [Nitrospiraceae bacterium]
MENPSRPITHPVEPDVRAAPVRIIEVGPRDGLQNEPGSVPTADKIAFIDALSRTGVVEIEVGSFVSPAAVPQLADTDEVFRKIERVPGVIYSALVPNERGLERARAVSAQKIAVFTAASETFTQRNIKATIRESLARFRPVVAGAKRDGMIVRGYVSTAVFCPYEGRIAPTRVTEVMKGLLDLGVDEISLGDTIGKASPADVRRLLDAALPCLSRDRLSLHFHDTYGMAVANALTAWWEYGVEAFDGSAGGLGGCPYAPGASGNVATEDLVYALKASGATVPVEETKVVAAARRLIGHLGRGLTSRLSAVTPG